MYIRLSRREYTFRGFPVRLAGRVLDGRYVAFDSMGTNLPGDTNNVIDIFVRNTAGG